ncbi:MAG: hypothetical protein ACRC2T_12895 [Thermoguttaceae bacterium]
MEIIPRTQMNLGFDIKVRVCPADLDIDSDNNGYINSDKNKDRQTEEDKIEETTPRPITYFPSTILNITDDYRQIPLRVTAPPNIAGSMNGVQYSFDYTDAIKVYKKGVSEPINKTAKCDLSDLATSQFYVVATGSGATDIDKIDFILWDSAKQEITRDTVKVKVSQSPDNWVVPPGWTINGADSFTMPMPVAGAIGPANEGSLPKNLDAIREKMYHLKVMRTR